MADKSNLHLDLNSTVLGSLGARNSPKASKRVRAVDTVDVDLYQWPAPSTFRVRGVEGLASMPAVSVRSDFYLCDQLEALAATYAGSGVRSRFWGVLPPDITEQLGLGPVELLRFMKLHADYDLFFFNLKPKVEALCKNLWQDAIRKRPEFSGYATLFLSSSSVGSAVLDAYVPSRLIAAGHGMVGNQRFWASYLPFVRNIHREVHSVLRPEQWEMLKGTYSSPNSIHHTSGFFQLLEECLLTEFLIRNPDRLRFLKVHSPWLEDKLNKHEKALRTLKDTALKTDDLALLTVWEGYLEVYLGGRSGLAEKPAALAGGSQGSRRPRKAGAGRQSAT